MKFCAIAAAVIVFYTAGAVYGRDDLQLRMIKIAYGNGAAICATARKALSPDGKMTFDEKTDTLAVVDRADYLPHIEELVSTLDIKAPVVEISARIAEVDDAFIRKAGIHSAQTIFPRGSFDIVLGLLNTRTGAFTKSDSTLKTASGFPARLQVSRAALFGAVKADLPGGGTAAVMQKNDTGDFLEVLPLVNSDNTVTVKLRPSQSTVREDGSVSESAVLTQVTLHSGDTLAIGSVGTQRSRSQRRTMMFLSAKIIY